TVNNGPSPKTVEWIPPATAAEIAVGMNARVENSNKRSWVARTMEATGAPNVAAIPPAAPQAKRIFLSDGDTLSNWPRSDPSDPPVTMIGPSAPNGPPLPMAVAADSGLATAVRGATRLWRWRIDSIASGMP